MLEGDRSLLSAALGVARALETLSTNSTIEINVRVICLVLYRALRINALPRFLIHLLK